MGERLGGGDSGDWEETGVEDRKGRGRVDMEYGREVEDREREDRDKVGSKEVDRERGMASQAVPSCGEMMPCAR